MAERRSPTMADIVAEYRDNKLREELAGNWAIVAVNRLPSFPLVWLFARLGISPMAVSFACAVVALALPALAWFTPLPAAGLAVFLAAWLFQVLDCVDGALARITDSGSEAGARADFLIDMAQWGLLYLAIGFLADRHLDGFWTWTALAAAAAWLRLYARVVRDAAPSAEVGSPPEALSAGGIVLAFFAGLSGVIPFLALAGPRLGFAVLFLLCYSLLDIADAAGSAFARSSR